MKQETVIPTNHLSPTRTGVGDVATLLERLQAIGAVTLSGASSPCPLRSALGPVLPYNGEAIERALAVTLPGELPALWERVSSLRLFEDVRYGQWGLILWSPDALVDAHRKHIKGREQDFRPGDVILGEFLGDSDLLVLRCDPEAEDYGHVLVALPIDPRAEWYRVGASLLEFCLVPTLWRGNGSTGALRQNAPRRRPRAVGASKNLSFLRCVQDRSEQGGKAAAVFTCHSEERQTRRFCEFAAPKNLVLSPVGLSFQPRDSSAPANKKRSLAPQNDI